jgi:hypothetical protein
MERVEAGPVNHKIDIETIEGRFESNFGCNPYKEIGVVDWLSFSEQVSQHGRPYRILQGQRFGDSVQSKSSDFYSMSSRRKHMP